MGAGTSTGEGPAFLRARRPEQKLQRSRAILAAARELAVADGIGEVSLADIAARVGMHKSALLKYFGTREEIFLRLAEAEWRDWAAAVVADLDASTGPASERVVGALGRAVDGRPLFCQLLMHSTLTLERNVSLDALRTSKLAAIGATNEVTGAVHRLLPGLDRDACFELVAVTGLVAAGLWQAAHPPPVVLALYAEQSARESAETGFARIARLDVSTEVTRFVRVFLAGLEHEGGPRA